MALSHIDVIDVNTLVSLSYNGSNLCKNQFQMMVDGVRSKYRTPKMLAKLLVIQFLIQLYARKNIFKLIKLINFSLAWLLSAS